MFLNDNKRSKWLEDLKEYRRLSDKVILFLVNIPTLIVLVIYVILLIFPSLVDASKGYFWILELFQNLAPEFIGASILSLGWVIFFRKKDILKEEHDKDEIVDRVSYEIDDLLRNYHSSINKNLANLLIDQQVSRAYEIYIQEISNYLDWMIRAEICDAIILYVRDEIYSDEFNIIGHKGLRDSSPMYGPLVHNDFRNKLNTLEIERYIPKIISAENEKTEDIKENKPGIISVENGRPEKFRARESVKAMVHFKLNDENADPLAVIYLNWREPQNFSAEKKNELVKHKESIFAAIKKLEGTSIKRQESLNAELRARRWIDYNKMNAKYENNVNELIFEAFLSFFEDFDRSKLNIEIATKQGNRVYVSGKKDYLSYFGLRMPIKNEEKSNLANFEWVIKTTKPLCLNKPSNNSSMVYKIIVAVRLPSSELKSANRAISIECVYKSLHQDMVKPLCYLADHIGRIEDEARQVLTSKQDTNRENNDIS